ncbi:MAG TPA: sigma factor-like helix-turn-helix DNA-binding protein [Thermoanaerobaculia bacterium]
MVHADDARISDETLIGRVAAGDSSAFARLIRRHGAMVYRFARAAAPQETDCEEILREAFLAARRGAGRYRDEPSGRSWLLALARRAVERRSPRPGAGSASFGELARAAARRGPAAWDGSGGPAEAVAAALAALPAEDREILTLYDRELLTLDEVARVTGIADAALRTRLHRARLRLLAELKGALRGG